MFKNNYFRFGITFLLCLQYSLLRETAYSTITKPLPIIFWLIVALFSERTKGGGWVLLSLSCAFIGDILLDLGEQWLKIGAIPFVASTALLAVAFQNRLRNRQQSASDLKRGLLFFLIAVPFILLYWVLVSYSTEAATTGAILFIISALLLWTALSNLLFNEAEKARYIRPLLGFIGACGIVANYVLYSIDLHIMPIPRDVVIQVYYWGTVFVTWSFLE